MLFMVYLGIGSVDGIKPLNHHEEGIILCSNYVLCKANSTSNIREDLSISLQSPSVPAALPAF